jgi:hypothetical protein
VGVGDRHDQRSIFRRRRLYWAWSRHHRGGIKCQECGYLYILPLASTRVIPRGNRRGASRQ